ncbi:TadA family conjugal transfer-associated ATPase [Microbacterium thalassium]|uniref:Pilus assembly protein CpaF n=1 Tax=Microbacterium thalassium TaxID=362649 RepID=A0A7X0FSZ7_9MICO|nr:TadA family conjugal transfer-associated ATPase [Microbacterium thalassium]MBB6392620.1 pilus assembly protein CpaF [Microbacterium thalassium]GLK23149.1 hypothetical protein GCM10017607_04670 [Microbacterium thalassium]
MPEAFVVRPRVVTTSIVARADAEISARAEASAGAESVLRALPIGGAEPFARVESIASIDPRPPASNPAPIPTAARWCPTPRTSGSPPSSPPDPDETRPRPAALAPFAAHLDDPEVSDLFINGSRGLFVDRGRGAEHVPRFAADESEVRDLAVALIGLGGRHIDDASPAVDVRLDGGLRVHAVLPPVSVDGTAISIRVPRLARPTLEHLEGRGMYDAETRAALEGIVARRDNVLVSGPAGAGKTTLLAAMLSHAAEHERIITVEDVAELQPRHPHHVRLEARQANLEGAGAVELSRLVREALRMRPDRLVVGECRGAEIRDLLAALNTGHDGGGGTIHANGLDDVPARLETLGALAGLDDRAIARQAASAVDVVIHVDRDADGRRRVARMGRPVVGADGRLGIEEASCT